MACGTGMKRNANNAMRMRIDALICRLSVTSRCWHGSRLISLSFNAPDDTWGRLISDAATAALVCPLEIGRRLALATQGIMYKTVESNHTSA